MTRTVVGSLALLALLPALRAGDKPENPSPAQRYQALVKEHQTAQRDFQEAFKEAKTTQEKRKVFQEMYPRPDKLAPHLLELAENSPKDPVALDALVWVVQNVQPGKNDPQSPRSKAIQILIRDHVRSEKMASVCPALDRALDEDSRTLLRAVLEKNKHRSAQGQACLALARQAEGRLNFARQFKERPGAEKVYEKFMDKEIVEDLTKADPEKLSKDAEGYYERIVKDFADMADPNGEEMGERAKNRLEALRHPILVGKQAPEIAGENINGKKFKLSDYRGKVVLLNFWGNWSPPCRTMFPRERSLVKRLEDKPFVLIGVNSDRDRAELKKVLDKEKITWRSFWNGGTSGPISSRWDVYGWPTLFLIDAKGVIRRKYIGSPSDEKLDEEIDKLVAEVEKTAAK